MKRLLVAASAIGLAFGVSALAEQPASSPSGISALIVQLGADSFADREAAVAALEQIGVPALDALRKAVQSDNQEVRDRASVLLSRIRRAADSHTRLLAKRVTLDYQSMPLGTAINDFKARTGLNITLDPDRVKDPLRRITCKTAELPVWESLEAFCTAAGLRESFQAELDIPKPTTPRRGYVPPPEPPTPEAVAIVLIDGKGEKVFGDRSTAVRVLALPPTFPGHKVGLGNGQITLALDVAPTPGLGWQEVVAVRISKVIDSEGRIGGSGIERDTNPGPDFNGGMVVFARPGMQAMVMRFDANGNSILPDSMANPRVLTVPLKLGTPSARSLRRLEGSLFGEVRVPDQQLITLDNPKQHTNEVKLGPGEMKFTVLQMKEPQGENGSASVQVQLSFPSQLGNRGRMGFGWPQAPRHPSQGNRVEAFDAEGKRMNPVSSGYQGMSDDGMTTTQTHTMTFRAGEPLPAKLAVVGPKSLTVEVPFVMENVPLP